MEVNKFLQREHKVMQRAFPEEEKQLDGHVGQGTAQVGDVQTKQLIYFVHVHVHATCTCILCRNTMEPA